jgi:hypothetical protein
MQVLSPYPLCTLETDIMSPEELHGPGVPGRHGPSVALGAQCAGDRVVTWGVLRMLRSPRTHCRSPGANTAPPTHPPQRYIIRLIFMVPVYAIGSWFSLKYRDAAIYFDTLRDWCAPFAAVGCRNLFPPAAACSGLVSAAGAGLAAELVGLISVYNPSC